MEIEYGNLKQLGWLWLVVGLFALFVVSSMRRRRAAARFATENLLTQIVPRGHVYRAALATLLLSLTIGLLAVSLVDIRWGKVTREVPQEGIEVVFLLDVSRSMLAEDATPNRLERAKQQIKDTIDEMSGDRVALVLFAGEVRQHIPLTSHYDDFKQTLELVGPHNVDRGGSRLGDAINVATRSFLSKTQQHKAIVIFTDGEDQESEPAKAARRARQEHGIRIFTVGLGDIQQGARIPIRSQNQRSYLQHEGQQVWSKLDGKTLQQIATETDGAYIPAGTKQVNMADVYHGYIANVEKKEFDTAKIDGYEARFQFFLGPAILLLLAEILLSTGSRGPRRPSSKGTDRDDSEKMMASEIIG